MLNQFVINFWSPHKKTLDLPCKNLASLGPNSWGFFVAFLQQQKGRPNIRLMLYYMNTNKTDPAMTANLQDMFDTVSPHKFQGTSDITRAKMSAKKQGVAKTQQHRDRIAQQAQGRRHTDQTRALISNHSRGRAKGAVRTPEQIERMRQAQLLAKAKHLMTPWGLFTSVGAAEQHARSIGIKSVKERLREWQKTRPTEFYFVVKTQQKTG